MSQDDAWFRTFPAMTDDERSTFAQGGMVAELAALARYSRRTGVSEGPALMFFRWDARQPREFSPEQVMSRVTRENATQVLASLTPDERTQFEWWFVARFGDRLPRPEDRKVYIGTSLAGSFKQHAEAVGASDLQSRYGAMHRAILASREPV